MHYADYKTILSPQNGMNLFRGCLHGCIYCDSRSLCYQMQHAFEDIEIKRDAPAILEAQLRRKRKLCMIATGSMSDPYMNTPETLAITRACLQVIERFGFGLAIQTKSALVLGDLDLLSAIHKKAKCVVEMTLTTFDEDLCRLLEPQVSTTKQRFEALETLRDAGIPTVVWLCPILPFINDNEENLLGILDYCHRAGVQGILCFGFGMTLRQGNREYYYAKLDRHFPGVKRRYIESFGESYSCSSPHQDTLWRIFTTFCAEKGILCDREQIFSYLHQYETQESQLIL